MILPDLQINSRVNFASEFLSPDTVSTCVDLKWFNSYPHQVSYQFNSRGFRGPEWPKDLKKSIWCVGDSATLGIGCPASHTWPVLLENLTGVKTVNISLEGASNHWIARKVLRILKDVSPDIIIIQWSFVHRRELLFREAAELQWPKFYDSVRSPLWPDAPTLRDYYHLPGWIQEEINNVHEFIIDDITRRTNISLNATAEEDIAETFRLIQKVERKKNGTKLIHSHVPESGFDVSLTKNLVDIGEVKKLDLARDGYHYDLQTSTQLVNTLVEHVHT